MTKPGEQPRSPQALGRLESRQPHQEIDPPVQTRHQLLPFDALEWAYFERLCLRLVERRGTLCEVVDRGGDDATAARMSARQARLYGVQGQRQQGIDLYVRLPAPLAEGRQPGMPLYLSLQSRRIARLRPALLRRAVTDFLDGTWAEVSSVFVYATSLPGVRVEFADEIERQAERLALQGIDFEVWDAESLSLMLKDQPQLVDDFFGRAWVEAFFGPEAVAAVRYLTQVRDLAPAQLLDRDDELAEIERFCRNDEPYLWWQAGPWAGKTALAAWTALTPPPGVAVASFIVPGQLSGEAHSDAYTEAMINQLAVIADEPIVGAETPGERDRERLRLVDRAAERARREGQILLLVVDGLDEDEGAGPGRTRRSIASLLPKRPAPGMKVMVTSREHPGIPGDVPPDHRLRGCVPRTLRQSEHAGNLRVAAMNELEERLYGGDQAQREIVGYLAASGGGLTLEDLAALSRRPSYLVRGLLAGTFGRSVTSRAPSDGPPDPTEKVYLFAHETLRDTAEATLGRDVDNYRLQIHAWANDYGTRGWPEDSPRYLLRSYGGMLAATRDLNRLVSLATDSTRQERMLAYSQSDASALAEITVAQQLLLQQTAPSLSALGRLAVRRTELAAAGQQIPSDLPAVWARVGNTYRAEALARGVSDAESRAQALAAVARVVANADARHAAALVSEAERAAAEISEPSALAPVLGSLSQALASTDPRQAERLAMRAEDIASTVDDFDIQGETLYALSKAFAECGMWDRAERVALGVEPADCRTPALDRLVRMLARAGRWDSAEHIAGEIDDDAEQAKALLALVKALSDAHLFDRAENLARSIDDPAWHAVMLAAVAERLTRNDPDRAVRLVTEAYQTSMTRGPSALIHVSISAAVVLTERDPAQAAGLVSHAERLAQLIEPAPLKVQALALLAKYFANTNPDKATQLAKNARQTAVADTSKSSQTLTLVDLSEALGDAGLWDQAEKTVNQIENPRAQARLLTKLADAVAGNDHTRAQRLAEHAERITRAIAKPEWPHLIWQAVLGALVRTRSWDRAEEVAATLNNASGHSNGSYHLAKAMAEAQHWDRAEQVAEAISDGQQRASALYVLAQSLTRAQQWQRAEQIAVTIISPHSRPRALFDLTDALAHAHRWNDAERIARSITDPVWQLRALCALIQSAAEWDLPRAEGLAADLARAIDELDESALQNDGARLCRALAASRHWDLAEAIAESLDEGEEKRQAQAAVSEAYANVHQWDDAERLARSVDDPLDQTIALATIIARLADSDPAHTSDLMLEIVDKVQLMGNADDRIQATVYLCEKFADEHLAEQTEQLARTIEAPNARAQMLVRVAKVLSATDPPRAAALLDEAESIIAAMEEPALRAWALASLARALAEAHAWDRAERVAESVDYPDERSWALLGFSEAAADAGLWTEAERVLPRINDLDRRAAALSRIITKLVHSTQTDIGPLDHAHIRRLLASSLAGADPFAELETAANALPTEIAELCETLIPAMLR